MPALEYKAAGDRIDTAALNAVWAEFERKMSVLLCNKSPLANAALARELILHDEHQTLGACFGFWPASSPLDRVFTRMYESQVPRYDHNVFSAAAAGAVITSYDEDRKIAFCAPPSVDLDRSLACHTVMHNGEAYRLATAADRAQKRYLYAVAEIIVEGEDAISIPDDWNKYNCFRIHNLDTFRTLTVRFGDHITFEVENLGCATVRRDSVAGTYTRSTYFWPFEYGDPSFYRCGLATSRWPERTLEANNVTNPSLIFRWAALLTSPDVRSMFGFSIDPEEIADMTSEYSDLLASPLLGSSYLLDLVAHKGDLSVIERHSDGTCTLHDAGWQGLGKAPQGPLQRAINIDGSVTLTTTVTDPADLLGVSSNLLHTAGAPRSVAPLPVTIPATLQSLLVTRDLGSLASTWSFGDSSIPITIHAGLSTVAETLRPTDTIELIHATFSGLGITIIDGAITPTGPTLITSQPIEWRYPFSDPFTLSFTGLTRVDLSTAGATIVQQHRLGSSWPSDAYGATLSLPARVQRVYAPATVDGLVQYITDISDDGLIEHEWNAAPPPFSGEASEIAIQSPESLLGQYNNHHQRPIYTATLPPDNVDTILRIAGDGTDEYQQRRAQLIGSYQPTLDSPPHFLRVPMLAEHWNHFAQLVNSLDHCRPLTIEDLYFADAMGNLITFQPNYTGLVTRTGQATTIRPLDQYANVTPGGLLFSFCEERDIPISSSADLPSDWAATCDVLSAQNTQTWRAIIERVYGPASYEDSTPPGYKRACSTYRYHFRGLVPHSSNLYGNTGFDLRAGHDIFCPQTARWITTAAVRDFADDLGVAFIHCITGRPLQIVTIASETPVITPWSVVITAPAPYCSTYYLPTDPALAAEFAAIDGTTYDESTYFPIRKTFVRLADALLISSAHFISNETDPQDDPHLARNVSGQSSQIGLIGPLSAPMSPIVVTDGEPASIRSIDATEIRSIATLRTATEGIQDDTVAICSTLYTSTMQLNYAWSSRANFDIWRPRGDYVIPLTLLAQDPEAAQLLAPAASDIIFPNTDQRAWSVRVVDQLWMTL